MPGAAHVREATTRSHWSLLKVQVRHGVQSVPTREEPTPETIPYVAEIDIPDQAGWVANSGFAGYMEGRNLHFEVFTTSTRKFRGMS